MISNVTIKYFLLSSSILGLEILSISNLSPSSKSMSSLYCINKLSRPLEN
jgi:hypothetical protein